MKRDLQSRQSYEQILGAKNHEIYVQTYRHTLYLSINQTDDVQIFESKYISLKFLDGPLLVEQEDDETLGYALMKLKKVGTFLVTLTIERELRDILRGVNI